MKQPKYFRFRAFGSILLLLSLLVMVATGLVLYFEPRGFASSSWGDAHAVFALLLVLAAAIHLIYNGRTLLGYLRTSAQDARFARPEWIAALFITIVCLFASTFGFRVLFQNNNQTANGIALPAPSTTGGAPLMQSISHRKSNRNYANAPLTLQQLSDILWAANGFNRTDGKSRTTPTAYGVNFVNVYVTTESAIYLYNAHTHVLELVAEGDLRYTTTIGQPYVKTAAVNLVYVANPSAWEASIHKPNNHAEMLEWAYFAAGAMAQNVGLVAASEGLGNVVRSSIPHDTFAKAAQLSSEKIVIVAHTVGVLTK